MSTCPDKIIYSEYLDGELPSPWKEKLETHISECADCDSALKVFSKISEAMHSEDTVCSSFDCDASYERLKTKFKQGHAFSDRSDSRESSFWKSAVRLPLPAVAAAVLALVLLPTFFFMSRKLSNEQQTFYSATYPSYNPNKNMGYNVSTASNVGEFSSSISEFMSMYMPTSNESEKFIIIKIPYSRLNTINGNTNLDLLFSNQESPLKTKESSE